MKTKIRFAPKKKTSIYFDREFILLFGFLKRTVTFISSKKIVLIILSVLLLLSCLLYNNILCFSYNVYLNGNFVGTVADTDEILLAHQEACERFKTNLSDNFKFFPSVCFKNNLSKKEKMCENIVLSQGYKKCAALKLNGEIVFTAQGEQAVLSVIDKYTKKYKFDKNTKCYFEGDFSIEHGIFKTENIKAYDKLCKVAPVVISETCEEFIKEKQQSVLKKPDETLEFGEEKVIDEGCNGESTTYVYKTWRNGELISEKVEEKTTKEPLEKVISVSAKGFVEGEFAVPVFGEISSYFGMRWGREHKGVDFAAYEGEDIFASDGGKVKFSGYEESFGNLVIIEHANGYDSYYAHMSKRVVSEGEYVSKLQKIGEVGSTGNSTGPHLHFEIRCNGKAVNPSEFIVF